MSTGPTPRWRNPKLLRDDSSIAPESLGCVGCVDRDTCGGAHMEAGFFDCNSFCQCSDKATCDLVCRGNPALYVERVREVDGLDLMTTPRAPYVEIALLPSMVPLIEHKSARRGILDFPVVVVPLYKLIDLSKGSVRFADRKALTDHFGIDPRVRLVVSGVGRDRTIESYWALRDRPAILAALQEFGISLITPPNYSVLTGVPRTDNLHAMKRIMIAFMEMAQAGLPAALHVNARTERDYERWTKVIAARPEIQCIAVEFATGAGHGPRIEWHVARLQELAAVVGRPLRLVIRGGSRALEALRLSFQAVTMLDTDAFHKTRCRKRAYFTRAGELVWGSNPTAKGEALDDLLQHNVATLHSHHTYLERLHEDRRFLDSSGWRGPVEDRNRKAV